MEPKINLVTLGVADFSRSLAFYRDGLGWKAKVQGDIAFFQMNSVIFSIYPRAALAKDANVPEEKMRGSGMVLAYNTENEKEVDEIIKNAEKIGAKIVQPPSKAEWGGYHGYFSDPDGYLWEIAYNPFWKLDEKGNVLL
jgi:uncharacterized protein